jgi:hypothetical protein
MPCGIRRRTKEVSRGQGFKGSSERRGSKIPGLLESLNPGFLSNIKFSPGDNIILKTFGQIDKAIGITGDLNH